MSLKNLDGQWNWNAVFCLLFVFVVWLGLTTADILFVWRYMAKIPIADDWSFIQGVSDCKLSLSWLWEQTADHRVPLQKLIMWLFWQIAPSELKWPNLFGVVVLAIASLFLVVSATHARKRSQYSDVFFPLLLLSFGHASNFLWWTTCGVLLFAAIAATVSSLAVIQSEKPRVWAAVMVGLGAILLSFLGSTGVAYALGLTPVLLTWVLRRECKRSIRICSAVVLALTIAVAAMYFINFNRSHIQSPYMGVMHWLKTAIEFASMGLGLGAKRLWPLSGILVVTVLITYCFTLVTFVKKRKISVGTAATVGLALISPIALSMAVGLGRQYQGGLVDRYMLYAAPLFCVVFMFFVKYELPGLSAFMQYSLCFFACAGLFWGFSVGLAMAKERKHAEQQFMSDLNSCIPLSGLVSRHGNCWALNEAVFRKGLVTLKKRNVHPYNLIAEDPQMKEVEVRLQLLSALNAEYRNGKWYCHGRESQIVLRLPSPQRVYAVRFSYMILPRMGSTMFEWKLWRRAGDCLDSTTGKVFKAFNTAKPPREESQTIWIDDLVSTLCISPSEGPCEFQIKSLTLFVPMAGIGLEH